MTPSLLPPDGLSWLVTVLIFVAGAAFLAAGLMWDGVQHASAITPTTASGDQS